MTKKVRLGFKPSVLGKWGCLCFLGHKNFLDLVSILGHSCTFLFWRDTCVTWLSPHHARGHGDLLTPSNVSEIAKGWKLQLSG